jgi:hypothetical protein
MKVYTINVAPDRSDAMLRSRKHGPASSDAGFLIVNRRERWSH